MIEIKNKKIAAEEFQKLRQEVLLGWPTGREVVLSEAVEYHKALPEEKGFARRLSQAKAENRTLIQPRAGVPVIQEHIRLMQYLQEEGGADLLPTTIDSYTRQNRYQEAENGIAESIRLNRAMLNGLPVVNHGVAKCRQVIESVKVPCRSATAPRMPGFWRRFPWLPALPALRAAVSPIICLIAKMYPWKRQSWIGSMWIVSPGFTRKWGYH